MTSQPDRPEHTYSAYGLTIHSEIPFPELLPGHGEADVIIRTGPVPDFLDNAEGRGVLFQATPDRFLLKLEHIAGYLVEGGHTITIQPNPEASDSDLRLFLLGSCFGALLHQRGWLVMHASAINTTHGAVLFTGPSGNGKSTLLGALVKRGHAMLSDDVTALALDGEGHIIALPGYPQIKIWADAAERLGNPVSGLGRVRPQLEKFAMPTLECFADSPTRLHAIYVLGNHNDYGGEIHLDPLEGGERFTAIRVNTYRQRFLDGLGMRPVHFRLAAAAANAARVVRVTRPKQPFMLDELVDCIEEDLA